MRLSPAAIAARMLTAGLPTLPSTVSQLESLIIAGDATIQIITQVIATDPAITALVIGQANASGHRTTSLADAIRHNGLGVVLATVRCAIPAEARIQPALSSCWAQANVVATLVPLIADHRQYHIKRTWDAEVLHVCGLTHDLGHVLALTHFPKPYASAAARCDAGEGVMAAMLEAELGHDLAGIANQACVGWSLPAPYTTVMAHWRRPINGGEHADLCAILHVAHMLAVAIGYTAGADRFVEPIDDWAMKRLDLRIADFDLILTRAFAALDGLPA